MTVALVVGTQWGDEGKGKIVDYLAKDYDIIVRFQGGSNAGHTVYFGGNAIRLHLLPSGVLRDGKLGVLTGGVYFDLEQFWHEITELESLGFKINVRVSPSVTLVLDEHKEIDAIIETIRGRESIGTTKRGIGPASADKHLRIALTLRDLYGERSVLEEKLEIWFASFERYFGEREDSPSSWAKRKADKLLYYADRISKYVENVQPLLRRAHESGKNILFEGAQGTLLDIEYGTYPYVTSSHTVAPAAFLTSGLPMNSIDRIIGVVKCYMTRVGFGPFPTELDDNLGSTIREIGKEYGATTGRGRRCGWLDLVLLKYAVRVNSITEFVLTKVDVLKHFPKVRTAVAYRKDNRVFTEYPEDSLADLASYTPVYEDFEGWESFEGDGGLNPNLEKFISHIEAETRVPIKMISIGTARREVIER